MRTKQSEIQNSCKACLRTYEQQHRFLVPDRGSKTTRNTRLRHGGTVQCHLSCICIFGFWPSVRSRWYSYKTFSLNPRVSPWRCGQIPTYTLVKHNQSTKLNTRQFTPKKENMFYLTYMDYPTPFLKTCKSSTNL